MITYDLLFRIALQIENVFSYVQYTFQPYFKLKKENIPRYVTHSIVTLKTLYCENQSLRRSHFGC